VLGQLAVIEKPHHIHLLTACSFSDSDKGFGSGGEFLFRGSDTSTQRPCERIRNKESKEGN